MNGGGQAPSFLRTGAAALVAWGTGQWSLRAALAGRPLTTAAAGAVCLVAAGLAAWAFRVEAARAFGPPGSPERLRRRLSRATVVRTVGIGLGVGALFTVVITASGEDASARRVALVGVAMGVLYGGMIPWSRWRRLKEDPPRRLALPGRPAPPPRARGQDLRWGRAVGIGFALLGAALVVSAASEGEADDVGIGAVTAVAGGGFALWCQSRPELREATSARRRPSHDDP